MPETKIPDKLKKKIALFTDKLKGAYPTDLVSVILYGSAASGEFVDNHSDLNFLICLQNLAPEGLKDAAKIVNKFPAFVPLFLTQEHINCSTDIFPIEFLDMQENYTVIYGKDILKNITVDIKNLRFQCEYELRIKLIFLRQLYLKSSKDRRALLFPLLKSFTSVLHILRNVLRLKGRTPPYQKDLIISELATLFSVDITVWKKILAVKNKKERLNKAGIEDLFIKFIAELEKSVELMDKL